MTTPTPSDQYQQIRIEAAAIALIMNDHVEASGNAISFRDILNSRGKEWYFNHAKNALDAADAIPRPKDTVIDAFASVGKPIQSPKAEVMTADAFVNFILDTWGTQGLSTTIERIKKRDEAIRQEARNAALKQAAALCVTLLLPGVARDILALKDDYEI